MDGVRGLQELEVSKKAAQQNKGQFYKMQNEVHIKISFRTQKYTHTFSLSAVSLLILISALRSC